MMLYWYLSKVIEEFHDWKAQNMGNVKDKCQKVIMPKRLMPVTKVLPNLYGSYLPATSGLHFSKARTSVELSN